MSVEVRRQRDIPNVVADPKARTSVVRGSNWRERLVGSGKTARVPISADSTRTSPPAISGTLGCREGVTWRPALPLASKWRCFPARMCSVGT